MLDPAGMSFFAQAGRWWGLGDGSFGWCYSPVSATLANSQTTADADDYDDVGDADNDDDDDNDNDDDDGKDEKSINQ